jgi:hypothetical protein
MSTFKLLDDQPVGSNGDRLHFHRFVNAIENHVLKRESTAPFVVGIYGKWGSGKSSLMAMIADKLRAAETNNTSSWEIVEFSPWMYRNEKSLLLPLLATIAKKQPVFAKLINEIVKSGPGLIKMLSQMGFEMATAGLPLLTFLSGIRQQKEEARDLREKIEAAVKEVTSSGKRLVFLIDDLDRCHDPAQIVGLLEQIKLFLHLDHCLFFICADKEQIIKAINKQFPGEGANYLEKFVQLGIELPSHQSHHLATIPAIEEPELRRYLMRIAEVLEHNPRKLKQLWNQALIAREIIGQEMLRVQSPSFRHEPSLELMLKWLLLKESESIRDDPYRYLALEQQENFEDFVRELGSKVDNNGKQEWRSEFHSRLAVFLWYDRTNHRYQNPRILSLYARASGEDTSRSRSYIETKNINSGYQFQHENFANTDLSGGHFSSATFVGCDFSLADLQGADLNNATFRGCNLNGVCFNNATLENTRWEWCQSLDALETEPVIYEMIADQAVANWREKRATESAPQEWESEHLFKMYKTILTRYEDGHLLTEEIRQRLVEKGRTIRDEILASLSR